MRKLLTNTRTTPWTSQRESEQCSYTVLQMGAIFTFQSSALEAITYFFIILLFLESFLLHSLNNEDNGFVFPKLLNGIFSFHYVLPRPSVSLLLPHCILTIETGCFPFSGFIMQIRLEGVEVTNNDELRMASVLHQLSEGCSVRNCSLVWHTSYIPHFSVVDLCITSFFGTRPPFLFSCTILCRCNPLSVLLSSSDRWDQMLFVFYPPSPGGLSLCTASRAQCSPS